MQTLADVADATHSGSLITPGCLSKEFFCRDGTLTYHREIGERKPWKVSYLRNLEDALGEDWDQFHTLLFAFLVNSLNPLEASTGRKDIDLFGQVMDKRIF
jgi:hypothetical protein